MLSVGLQAQETTGGLQGIVKDAGGAVVQRAVVELNGTALVGARTLQTDSTGYYRFANLAPGVYSVTVKASGFATLKRDGITIEVGHLPSLELTLKVGSEATVVEVTAEAPLIDVTGTRTLTNVTEAVIADIPHGRSYQSVIQFAPSARNEPLAGSAMNPQAAGGNGNGGDSPGNGGNGQTYGFSVGGGADSENAYLVEGQETASPVGGTAHTNVPFEFIQEVQIKSSGIEAEHGGALGGVVNVIMKKGTNQWHGEFGLSYESAGMDAGDRYSAAYTRFNPQLSQTSPSSLWGGRLLDVPSQGYQPKKDSYKDVLPSFTLGGALIKDRLFAFVGFAPEYNTRARSVDFGSNDNNAGVQKFNRDQQTYYSNARLDFKATNKLNLFASWMYQYQRETGAAMPRPDSVSGLLYNADASSPLSNFVNGIGFAAPNTTWNFGGDYTITPRLVSTTRFGYFFENYHDFGYPTAGTIYVWSAGGSAANTCPTNDPSSCNGTGGSVPFSPTGPEAGLMQARDYSTNAYDQNFTHHNADKHHQFDQDLAWFKSGRTGTHNVKFGYQYNRIENDIDQRQNAPIVFIAPGTTSLNDYWGGTYGIGGVGTYGEAEVMDTGNLGKVHSANHAFFAQDAWTIGKGLTINVGIRFEHENIPLSSIAIAAGDQPLEFGWGSKIAPRIGAAWDVFQNGKLKVFGSYGVFNDMMKLNLALGSFGGQWWNSCYYNLNDPNYKDIAVAPAANGRYCSGDDQTAPALLSPVTLPDGVTANQFTANINFRDPATNYFEPNMKPYRQHESVLGADYQLKKDLALEVRWDRRRLDHAIEDTAINVIGGNEVWQVVNPGEGKYAKNVACVGAGLTCPPNIHPQREYDGIEFRLNKAVSQHWGGMLSYTYSKLWGNYSGLTSTDMTDGGGGRNSPNNSRAFDEPYFQYDAYGKSSSGLLGTDRPNTFKGYAYYELKEGKKATTTIGLFQTMYQGTPLSSFIDVGSGNGYGVYPEGRGKWVDFEPQDPTTGILTVKDVRSRRTPWYIQSDINLAQEFKVNKNNERNVLGFEATISNLFNQHSPLAIGSHIDPAQGSTYIAPGGLTLGNNPPAAYLAYESPYPWKTLLNTDNVTFNSNYNQVLAYQIQRNIRLKIRFSF
jgi:hypothetical protein